jgi:tRNA threonylcarbamoyladenosine biosynthesis protein TsaE
MQRFDYTANNLTDTDRLARALARLLPETATVALEGTLGAGKTRLVQAIAAASGVDGELVTSPTFVLCQPYCGARQLYHLDAYRVQDLDEFLELGVEEYFDGPGITLIEWADRVAACLPDDRLEIRIDITGPTTRLFQLSAFGSACQQSLARIAEALASGSC